MKEKCTGEGNGNPLQCSCLENPRDGKVWWAAIYGVTKSRTWLKWLSSNSSILLIHYKISINEWEEDKVRIKWTGTDYLNAINNHWFQMDDLQLSLQEKKKKNPFWSWEPHNTSTCLQIWYTFSFPNSHPHLTLQQCFYKHKNARSKKNSTLQWTITNINGKTVFINNNSWSKLFYDWIKPLLY